MGFYLLVIIQDKYRLNVAAVANQHPWSFYRREQSGSVSIVSWRRNALRMHAWSIYL